MLEGWFSGSSFNAVLNNLMKHDRSFHLGLFIATFAKTCRKTGFYTVDVFTVFLRLTKCVLCEYHMTLGRKKKRNLANKLFSTICICIIICILIDYRDLGRRRCTKENCIPNQFQSSWWGTDMEFLFCVSSYASRYAAEITDTHFKPQFD